MANTKKLTKDERKKTKRAARKKIKAEKPKKPRDYARGSKKRKGQRPCPTPVVRRQRTLVAIFH
jgi:hypothetical protein